MAKMNIVDEHRPGMRVIDLNPPLPSVSWFAGISRAHLALQPKHFVLLVDFKVECTFTHTVFIASLYSLV